MMSMRGFEPVTGNIEKIINNQRIYQTQQFYYPQLWDKTTGKEEDIT